MPFVSGFLRIRKRGRPGHPDNELPGTEDPTDPDYGVDLPVEPDHELPPPPPGLWPPLTPEHPWEGLKPDHPIALPPGTIWPPLPPQVKGKYIALVLIGGGGHGAMYRYVVIDADLRPEHPMEPGGTPTPTAQQRRT